MFHPEVRALFDHETWTVTYVVFDPKTRDAVVIDPVLAFDALSAQTSTKEASRIIDVLTKEDLILRAVLETHAHADHLSSAAYLAAHYGVPVGIGAGIDQVQKTFAPLFGLPKETPTDGSQFDLLLEGGQTYALGSLRVKALSTPGHTPACLSYLIGDAVFTGDALFLEDYGTGRTDFPAGSAKALYHSVHEVLYRLPGDTRVFVGHDYQPGGREVLFESTIQAEQEKNVQLRADTTEEQFVALREARDKALRPPRLLYPSIQVNVFGGHLPQESENGFRYLKTPLNLRCPTDDVGRPKQDQDPAKCPDAAE